MFCIKCGRPAATGNFCKECFLRKESLFELEGFRLSRCDVCGNYYDGLKKTDIGESVKRRVKTSHEIKRIGVSYRKSGNRLLADVTCEGIVKPFRKKETRSVAIIVATRKCDDCTKLSGNYYEAVFQVRGEGKERILDRIEKSGALHFVKRADNGYDVRFVRKADASRLSNEFPSAKRTFKLVGEKGGKKISRTYYSIRQ